MTIEDRMRHSFKKRIPFLEAIATGVLLGILLIFFTPRCQPEPAKVIIDYSSNIKIPELEFVLDSLSQNGYSIDNHFPIYVRLYKPVIPGDEKEEAVRIAKAIKGNTGANVQVQLDFDGGRYFAHPEKGIIIPIVK
ncbi:hypothetical protein KAH81_04270 [bacterium]|nr:hypothetical protein [bacterium]